MEFKIHNRKYNDYIVIQAKTIEEIREIAKLETGIRGWDEKDCWSERVE